MVGGGEVLSNLGREVLSKLCLLPHFIFPQKIPCSQIFLHINVYR